MLVPLDRPGTVEQVLVVLGDDCRLGRESHLRTVQGGRQREELDVVVVAEDRESREVGKAFVGVQLVLPSTG